MRFGHARIVAVLTLVHACAPAVPPRVTSPTGMVKHHYDRNALVASEVAGRFVIALTEAGSLLRFDRKTLTLEGEHAPARPAVALSAADDQGAVLVGFSGGRIARLQPATFALTPMGEVPGQPVFIVRDPAGSRVVVVFGKPIAGPYGWARRGLHDHRARALDGAWETRVAGPTTFLVDRRRRLWLGRDQGEWGGGIELIDFESGRLVEIPWGTSGVYGLIERPNHEIWGFGGMSHLGISDGYVARVQPGRPPRVLFDQRLSFGLRPQETQKAQALVGKRPVGPISHLVAPGAGDRLLLVSKDEVFATDVRFSAWKHLAAFSLDVPPGRPDAVGSYPGLRSWSMVDGDLLLTTVRDGLATLDPDTGKVSSHRLAGQMVVRPETVVPTHAGPVVSGVDDGPTLWNANAASPPTPAFRPPPPRVPTDANDARWTLGWGPPRHLPLPNGDTLVLAKWGPIPPRGVGISSRRSDVLVVGVARKGHLSEFTREVTELHPSDVFLLREEIWACCDGLWTLREGRWQRRADASEIHRVDAFVTGHGDRALVLVSVDGGRALARLTVGPGSTARLQRLEVSLDGRPVAVSDALAIDADRVLIATGSGLAVYDVVSGRVSRVALAGLDGEVHRLVRDGSGRIWIGGRGLWLLDGLVRAIAVRAAVPAVIDTDVDGLVARGDRLYLALGDRGLAVVDADALAAAALGGRLPPVTSDDGPRPHEARFGDHAVFVDLRSPVRWPRSQSWEQRFAATTEKVMAALDRSEVRAVLAEDGFEDRGELTLYTDDSAGVVTIVEGAAHPGALGARSDHKTAWTAGRAGGAGQEDPPGRDPPRSSGPLYAHPGRRSVAGEGLWDQLPGLLLHRELNGGDGHVSVPFARQGRGRYLAVPGLLHSGRQLELVGVAFARDHPPASLFFDVGSNEHSDGMLYR